MIPRLELIDGVNFLFHGKNHVFVFGRGVYEEWGGFESWYDVRF